LSQFEHRYLRPIASEIKIMAIDPKLKNKAPARWCDIQPPMGLPS
jgi:hypothetical protein